MQLGRYRVVLLYVGALLAIAIGAAGCAVKKNSVEKVTTKDSIAYALPGRTEISLNALCDTVERVRFKNVSGPVKTEVKYVDGVKQLVIQYDTIFKEKVVYRDREKTVEVVKWKTNWSVTWWAAVGAFVLGVLIMWLKPWKKLFV